MRRLLGVLLMFGATPLALAQSKPAPQSLPSNLIADQYLAEEYQQTTNTELTLVPLPTSYSTGRSYQDIWEYMPGGALEYLPNLRDQRFPGGQRVASGLVLLPGINLQEGVVSIRGNLRGTVVLIDGLNPFPFFQLAP